MQEKIQHSTPAANEINKSAKPINTGQEKEKSARDYAQMGRERERKIIRNKRTAYFDVELIDFPQ